MSKYIISLIILIGVLQLGYTLPVQAATPTTSTNALSAQLTLKPRQEEATATDLAETAKIIEIRLEKLELQGSYQVNTSNGEIQITLSESQDMPYIATIVTSLGHIEFVDGGAELPPLGETIQTGSTTDLEQGFYQHLFTSSQINTFLPPVSGDIFYQLMLNHTASTNMSKFVATKPDNYICMVLDKQVLNCSSMYYWSPDTLEILPNLSSNSTITLNDLAVFIHSGPLPMALEIVE